MDEEREGAYNRGVRDTRLNDHDFLFKRLELGQFISYIITVVGFGWLTLTTQRLGDHADASAKTTIALAIALKEEKDTARDTLAAETQISTKGYTRFQTVIAGGSLIVSSIGIAWVITH